MDEGSAKKLSMSGGVMALYRSVRTAFWTDSKVTDDFTPEDKYFYLYLFTNPHTNLCGCYEISRRQVAYETGYSVETIDRLIERFEKVHQVIMYDKESKEILLINWHKYNWTSSDKFRKPLQKEIESIKSGLFRSYLTDIFNGIDTVSIPYQYGTDTPNANTNTIANTNSKEEKPKKAEKPKKSIYGSFKNVALTGEEYQKLQEQYGNADDLIEYLGSYKEEKGYKTKSDYLTIKRWVVDAVKPHKKPTVSIPLPEMFRETPKGVEENADIVNEIRMMQERLI